MHISARLQREKEDEERRHLEEMSEDEYDALSEQQKAAIDRQRLEVKKQRLQRSNFYSVLFKYFRCKIPLVVLLLLWLDSL